MDIAGAQIAASMQRPETPTIGLQIHQRFAAEVLNVSGDQVTLVLEGTPFVARLANAEQAAALQGQRFATFQVKEYTPNLIQLQLLSTVAPQPAPTTTAPPKTPSTLIPNLLRLAGLPEDEANIMIAQALVKGGLPVNAEVVNELRSSLSKIGAWGQAHANQAANLKASSLPLSPQAILLALQQEQGANLVELMRSLSNQLQKAIHDNPQHAQKLQQMLSLLNQLRVDWSADQAKTVQQLQQAIPFMSRPIERDLAQFLKEHLPLLNTIEGQASFEQALSKLMQDHLSFLSVEERAALQEEIIQLLAHTNQPFSTAEGQAMLTRELMRLIQERVPFLQTLQGQTAFGVTLSTLIQSYLPQLTNTDGIMSFEQALFELIQRYAQLTTEPEKLKELQNQLSQLVQKHLYTLSTPQGQSLFERELAHLIQQYSVSQPFARQAEGNPALKDLLTLLNLPKGTALEQDISHFIKNNLNILSASHQANQLEADMMRLKTNKAQFLESTQGDAHLLQLAKLRGELSGTGLDTLLKEVDKLLDRIRWVQYENVMPQSQPQKAQWLILELPIQISDAGEKQQPKVQLKVAYQSKDKDREIDPNNTHILLHFELGLHEESIDVDMAIVDRKIGAQVIVSNQALQPIAEDELSSLADGLKELGYLLQTARCELARPKRVSLSEIQSTTAYPENPLGSFNLTA